MSAKRYRIACVLIVIVSQASAAMAQSGGRDGWQTDFYQPVPPLPPELAFTYHHASTALEGALRGESQRIHAAGNYLISQAQAMICREQARALALGNQRRWIEYRVSMRNSYELKRQQSKAALRQINNAKRATRTAVFHLESDQLDLLTGAIEWPVVLQAAEYDDSRVRLQQLFHERAEDAITSAECSRQIARYTRTLSERLLRNRFAVSRGDYFAAQKFLCGLKYEAELLNSPESAATPDSALTSVN